MRGWLPVLAFQNTLFDFKSNTIELCSFAFKYLWLLLARSILRFKIFVATSIQRRFDKSFFTFSFLKAFSLITCSLSWTNWMLSFIVNILSLLLDKIKEPTWLFYLFGRGLNKWDWFDYKRTWKYHLGVHKVERSFT